MPSRFSHERALLNVRGMISKTGTRQKDVAAAIGLSESSFTQKLRAIRNHFTLEELGRIGEYFSRQTTKPLTGWPLYDERYADLIDAGIAQLKQRA